MEYYTFYSNFAAANTNYDCNAYGAGSYNQENCVVSSTEADGGRLPDTGAPVVASAIGGVLLITVGAVLLIKMRRDKKTKAASNK